MAALPYMQFCVSEYLADTTSLNTAELNGAYLLLLFDYWQTGEALPNDPEYLAAIARVSNDRWTTVAIRLQRFFDITPETWVHHRMEVDLEEVKGKVKQAIKAGKASGAARKRKSIQARKAQNKGGVNGRSTSVPTDVPTPVPTTVPTEGQRKGNEVEEEEEVEVSNKRLEHSANAHLFDAFWNAGMRKKDKKKAKTVFNKILKSQSHPDQFTATLCLDVRERLDTNQLGFVEMHPTTYLNGERWNDEIVVTTAPNVTSIREKTDLIIAALDAEDAHASH